MMKRLMTITMVGTLLVSVCPTMAQDVDPAFIQPAPPGVTGAGINVSRWREMTVWVKSNPGKAALALLVGMGLGAVSSHNDWWGIFGGDDGGDDTIGGGSGAVVMNVGGNNNVIVVTAGEGHVSCSDDIGAASGGTSNLDNEQ